MAGFEETLPVFSHERRGTGYRVLFHRPCHVVTRENGTPHTIYESLGMDGGEGRAWGIQGKRGVLHPLQNDLRQTRGEAHGRQYRYPSPWPRSSECV